MGDRGQPLVPAVFGFLKKPCNLPSVTGNHWQTEESMTQPDSIERFVQQLAESQNRIYGYVYSLIGDHTRAADVVQETNLVLWRKIDEFQPTKPFLPWAFAIAKFQVLANLRDQRRDRMLLDAELTEKLSSRVERDAERIDDVRVALRSCLQRLTPNARDLIETRYIDGELSIADIAEQLGCSLSGVKVALMRARRALAECIEQRLAAEGQA